VCTGTYPTVPRVFFDVNSRPNGPDSEIRSKRYSISSSGEDFKKTYTRSYTSLLVVMVESCKFWVSAKTQSQILLAGPRAPRKLLIDPRAPKKLRINAEKQ